MTKENSIKSTLFCQVCVANPPEGLTSAGCAPKFPPGCDCKYCWRCHQILPWQPLFRRPWSLRRGLHLLRWPELRPVQVSAPRLRLRPQRWGSKQLLSQRRRVQGDHWSDPPGLQSPHAMSPGLSVPAPLPARLWLWPRRWWPQRELLCWHRVCPVRVPPPGLWLRPQRRGPRQLLPRWTKVQRQLDLQSIGTSLELHGQLNRIRIAQWSQLGIWTWDTSVAPWVTSLFLKCYGWPMGL